MLKVAYPLPNIVIQGHMPSPRISNNYKTLKASNGQVFHKLLHRVMNTGNSLQCTKPIKTPGSIKGPSQKAFPSLQSLGGGGGRCQAIRRRRAFIELRQKADQLTFYTRRKMANEGDQELMDAFS